MCIITLTLEGCSSTEIQDSYSSSIDSFSEKQVEITLPDIPSTYKCQYNTNEQTVMTIHKLNYESKVFEAEKGNAAFEAQISIDSMVGKPERSLIKYKVYDDENVVVDSGSISVIDYTLRTGMDLDVGDKTNVTFVVLDLPLDKKYTLKFFDYD